MNPPPPPILQNNVDEIEVLVDKMVKDGILNFLKRRAWKRRFNEAGVKKLEDFFKIDNDQWDMIPRNKAIKMNLMKHVSGLKDTDIPMTHEERTKDKQKKCSHINYKEVSAVKSTQIDIDEIICDECGLVLVRDFSTNYDTDPKSEIRDWKWYESYYMKKYKSMPNINTYNVINIDNEEEVIYMV